jgi:hypothetical protein
MTHRRITPSRVEAGETARAAALIAGPDRHGVIDGVHIDFRHPDLDPAEWEPAPWWYVWGDGPAHAGILFPSEVAAGSEEDLRFIKGDLDVPLIAARAGDVITVRYVTPLIRDGRFDHPHDKTRMLAFLRIERPSGEIVEPNKPLTFFGATILREAATRDAFDHLLSRACVLSGTAHLYEQGVNGEYPGRWSWNMPLEEIGRHLGADAHDAYFRLLKLLPDEGLGYLRQLANKAALAGFLIGKAEAKKAEHIAGAVLANRDKATAATTRIDWRVRAAKIWQEHPLWKRRRVAKLIQEDDPDAELSSIMRSIRKLDPHLKHGG